MTVQRCDTDDIANATCPGLHWKPQDAAIGRLLAPYCPSGRQGDSKQNNYIKCTHFAGLFDGRGGAPVLYRTHRPMEDFHKKATKHRHRASARSHRLGVAHFSMLQALETLIFSYSLFCVLILIPP